MNVWQLPIAPNRICAREVSKQRGELKLRQENEAETVRQWDAFAESIVAE